MYYINQITIKHRDDQGRCENRYSGIKCVYTYNRYLYKIQESVRRNITAYTTQNYTYRYTLHQSIRYQPFTIFSMCQYLYLYIII